MIEKGAWLGMLGGGQLGRMFTEAAHKLGYKVCVLDPDRDSPAGAISDMHLCAGYDDLAALEHMKTLCAAVTTEFENIPVSALKYFEGKCLVRPAFKAVEIAQDRKLEKNFFKSIGCETAPFLILEKETDISSVAEQYLPGILKTCRFGYDGKGQKRVSTVLELAAAFKEMGGVPAILEKFISFKAEPSIIAARTHQGEKAFYPITENIHKNGILDISIAPARLPAATQNHAEEIAARILDQLEYVGVLGIEFFVMEDGRLLLNEMATRPHNSGHYTMDACTTSQFEQQVRALIGMPLGDTSLKTPAVMLNLLGDLWAKGEPDWSLLKEYSTAHLHLYGKKEPRKGRKMGHVNILASNVNDALRIAEEIHKKIRTA